jgi:hypothetical protein
MTMMRTRKGRRRGCHQRHDRNRDQRSHFSSSRHPQVFRGLLAAVVDDVEITFAPSTRPLKPARLERRDMVIHVVCPVVRDQNPKPRAMLNHFTVPLGTCALHHDIDGAQIKAAEACVARKTRRVEAAGLKSVL